MKEKNVEKVAFLKMGIPELCAFWQDSVFNGEKDAEDGSRFARHFMKDGIFSLMIDLSCGQVLNWPKDWFAELCYKVKDGGQYFLLNEKQEIIGEWKGGYVPEGFCTFAEEREPWWGNDYISFDVQEDGTILFWKQPKIKWKEDVLNEAPKFDRKKIQKESVFWEPVRLVQPSIKMLEKEPNKFEDQLFFFISQDKALIRGKNGIYNYRLIANQETEFYEIHAKRGSGCREEDEKSEIPPPAFIFSDSLVLRKERFAAIINRLLNKENPFSNMDDLHEKLAQITKALVGDDIIANVLSKAPHLRGFTETHEMRTIFEKMDFD